MIIVGSSLFILYVVFQARFLIAGPHVTFQNQPETEQSTRTVTLEGVAENIVRISLNDRPVYTDKSGYFKEVIILENGYTVSTIRAQDRYGRSRSYTKEFIYTPALTSR